MRKIRLLAVATLATLAAYFVLRALASSCTGAACDAYIPVSLLLPAAIVALVAINGVVATTRARGKGPWFTVLMAATGLGLAGPIVALLLLRDNPDAFVLTATILVLIAVGTHLAFSLRPTGETIQG